MLTDMQGTFEIAEGAASNDPDIGVRAVAALPALTERLEILHGDDARALRWSWQWMPVCGTASGWSSAPRRRVWLRRSATATDNRRAEAGHPARRASQGLPR